MEQVLQILKDEFNLAMMLSGRIVHIAVVFCLQDILSFFPS